MKTSSANVTIHDPVDGILEDELMEMDPSSCSFSPGTTTVASTTDEPAAAAAAAAAGKPVATAATGETVASAAAETVAVAAAAAETVAVAAAAAETVAVAAAAVIPKSNAENAAAQCNQRITVLTSEIQSLVSPQIFHYHYGH